MLSNWKFVILRPQQQAQSLVDFVQEKQGLAVVLPMLNILPIVLSDTQLTQALETLTQADYVLVTSQNAVHCLPEPLIPAFAHTKVISIGEATTQALAASNINAYFTAPAGSSSEALLSELWLQPSYIEHKKFVILAGIGGRDLLAQTLLQRGAQVDVITVYQQQKIDRDLTPFFQQAQQDDKHYCFIATSLNIVSHLIELTPPQYKPWLTAQRLICISERIAAVAKKYGFQHIFIATSAHPLHIEETLPLMLKI